MFIALKTEPNILLEVCRSIERLEMQVKLFWCLKQVRWQYDDSPEVRNGLPSPHVAKSQSSRESTQPGENVSPEK